MNELQNKNIEKIHSKEFASFIIYLNEFSENKE
jgi:hypothetical protein